MKYEIINLDHIVTECIVLGLKSEYVMQAEWDKCALQELDITATDLSTECLIDLLGRIPNLRYVCYLFMYIN